MDLPFLIVHGAIVWKLGLAGLLGVVGVLHLGLRRRAAHRRARDVVGKLDRELHEGVVRGTLGGTDAGALASTVVADGTAYDERAGELWIETADGRVGLQGAVRVIAGSRADAARNGVPRGTSDALLGAAPALHRRRAFWSAKVRVATLASVRAGDEVIASGRLERAASGEPSDYRVGTAVLTLCAPENGRITLAARAPRVASPRTALWTIALVAAFVGGVGYKVELVLGDVWRETCRDQAPPYGKHGSDSVEDAPLELTNTHACALAAAMPDRHASALDATLQLFERHSYRDEATARQIFDLARLAEDCDHQLERLMAYERYEDAEVEARRCGDRHTEHLALLAQGKLDEAVAVVAPSSGAASKLPDGPEWIAIGRWNEAALAMDAVVAAHRGEPHEPRYQQYYELQALQRACIAELFHHFAGDAAAADRLRAIAAGRSDVCRSVVAQIAPPAEQPALLKYRSDVIDSELINDLSWADGSKDEPFAIDTPESLLVDLASYNGTHVGPFAWLVSTVPPPAPTAGMLANVTRLQWLTVRNVLDGDLTAATTNAQAARALAGPAPDAELASIRLESDQLAKDIEVARGDKLAALERRYDAIVKRERELYQRLGLRDVSLLPAVTALYTPVTAVGFDLADDSKNRVELWDHDFGRLWLRHGDPIDKGYFGGDAEYLAALKAAATGDARPLAREIGNQQIELNEADVIAVLPRIRIGREALARQLVWAMPPRASRVDEVPLWNLALHAVARREVLRLAGATDAAARWDTIYRRFDRILEDRRRLLALMMWEQVK